MPGFREYNAKLAGLRSMRRVTSTMKMVSATHLQRAQNELRRAGAYGAALRGALAKVYRPEDEDARQRLGSRAEVRNGLIVVFTSNRGLCGAFNATVYRGVQKWVDENRGRYSILRGSFCGRKGWLALRHRLEVRSHYDDAVDHPNVEDACRIGRGIGHAFMDHRYDEIFLAYNHFVSPLTQELRIERLLPLDPPAAATDTEGDELIREPKGPALVERLLMSWSCFRIFEAFLHNAASEHGARMTAMENANTNINKMDEQYTLLRNRARQSAITTELNEIVGGAEAMKG